uniref:Thiolase C-terminal domain-containing protein n=1 Tax=Plectus sambesii TaxID=2011161 RepID=A0A914VT68_9BILA
MKCVKIHPITLLEDCTIEKDAVARWEISESYSVTTLVAMKTLHLDHSKVNVNGGCVSLGHPFAATGGRLPVHLIHSLKQGELGVVALSNGGGEAIAMLIEKL